MSSLYYANITIHVLAAMLWLGGMLFLGLIGAPVLRAVEPPELRQRLFQDLGLRFRSAGWWAIGILLLTGVGNLHYKGWLRWDGVLGSPVFWRTAVGHSLAIKLVAVTAMIAVSAVHDFVDGPRASGGLASHGRTPSSVCWSSSSRCGSRAAAESCTRSCDTSADKEPMASPMGRSVNADLARWRNICRSAALRGGNSSNGSLV